MPPILTLSLLFAGYCTQAERFLFRDGGQRTVRFPATCALLEHPERGLLLYDTGYSERFFTETAHWPFGIYRKMTPVFLRPEETTAAQLRRLGVEPAEIESVILSHFHADHIAGVMDFPGARFRYFATAYQAVRGKRGLAALRAAYLPGLLPGDFEQRSDPVADSALEPLPADFSPFVTGVNLLGDGSLWGIPVPGHAAGQMALLVHTRTGWVLLAADALWHSRAYREAVLPNPLVRLIFDDWVDYCASFAAICELHRRHPDIRIIPTHCEEVWGSWKDVR
jgi:glyoxylase-like metal-dependent hydrolase (beta-lactamase superfamily II)